MASQVFSAGLTVLPYNHVKRPPIAVTTSHPPSNAELDAMELPDYGLTGNHTQASSLSKVSLVPKAENATGGAGTPKTPDELEESQSPSGQVDSVARFVPSWSYPRMNKWRHLSACLEYFGNGLNDAAPGALIPYIQAEYDIGYAVVSLIWISNAIGFILAAFFADFLNTKLGRAKSLMLAELSMIAAYAVIASPVPFPPVAIMYFFIGFSEAVMIALNNVFCSNLANPTVMSGAAHGSYGIGGILAPIVATTIVSRGISWHLFYIIPMCIRIACLSCSGWSFWKYEQEETTQFGNSLVEIASRQSAAETGQSKDRSLFKVLKNRTVIIGALFIFAYQGIEVSEAGWFISYLIAYRNAKPARVGYVTSGFWGGITVGRFVLTHVARRVGEKRFVFCMFAGIVVFQLLAWFIPNIIGDSVAVSIVGLLIGPVYPCAQTIFTRLLPGNVQVFAIGFISSAGSRGGAVVPFLTGLLAQVAGTFVLHPICIAFCFVCLACWTGLPRIVKRTE